MTTERNPFPKLHNFNDMYTPDVALDYIYPFLDKSLVYWEACWGKGYMVEALYKRGLQYNGRPDMDCLVEEPTHWDFFITNPPFNGHNKFIRRAIELGKPFAFLLRLEHLGGVEICSMLKDIEFGVIIPEKRINYITPKVLAGESVGGSQFHSIWLTHGVGLPKQINYVTL